MALNRRKWITSMATAGAAALLPLRLFADTAAAFKAADANTALKQLFGDLPVEESTAIEFKIPDIAENGAVVPVTVSTDLSLIHI